ncbi:uncharacterized protein LOC117121796, partial [Anneissia japonica]|uniref:uncharacterized protein LOC117121796 n=1 Tax=Anneissia japonica TaxID=1529436 RepID=UPI0014257BDB
MGARRYDEHMHVYIEGAHIHNLGDTARFKCKGNRTNESSFHWSSSPATCIIQDMMKTCKAECIIPITDEMHALIIKCEIKEGDVSASKSIVLHVIQDKPTVEKLNVQIEGSNQSYEAGQPVKLTCKGNKTSDANFTWCITPMSPDDEYVWKGMRAPIMSTENITAEQNGTSITCGIKENIYSGSANFTLIVSEDSKTREPEP